MKNKPNGTTAMDVGRGDLELRPGGMVVQMRNPDSDQNHVKPPTIGVRVKFGSSYHELIISAQATFGELKKMLSGPTGLHHQDQKLFFKGKERDSKLYLDVAGVKDTSKMVVLEDPISQEKRLIEMRKVAKMEKASNSISEIVLEVDNLEAQVSALESVISRGQRVAESEIVSLIEQLMNQVLKLDEIVADGDVKQQGQIQAKRIQKCVEALDVLKVQNSMSASKNSRHISLQQSPSPPHDQQRHSNGQHDMPSTYNRRESKSRHSSSGTVVITTKWETFDCVLTLPFPSTTNTTSKLGNGSVQPECHLDLL